MADSTESSQLADCSHIPIIDLSTLDSPNFDDRQKLAQSIYDACTQVGFFYIKVVGSYRTLGPVQVDTNSSCLEPRDSRGQNQWHTQLRKAAL